MAEEFKTPNTSPPRRNIVNNTFCLKEINTKELQQIITELKNGKTPGTDGIQAETLKKITMNIVDPLRHLINKIFETGIFPRVFKIGVVKPIYKKGDKMLVSNYRPIILIHQLLKNNRKGIEKSVDCVFGEIRHFFK